MLSTSTLLNIPPLQVIQVIHSVFRLLDEWNFIDTTLRTHSNESIYCEYVFFIDRKLSFCVWNSPSSLLRVVVFGFWKDSEASSSSFFLIFHNTYTSDDSRYPFFQPAKATSAPLQQTFELSDLNSLAKQKLPVESSYSNGDLFSSTFFFTLFFLFIILYYISSVSLFYSSLRRRFTFFTSEPFFFHRTERWSLEEKKKEEKLEKSNDLSSFFHWKTDFLRFLSLLQTYFNPLSTCLPSLSFSSIPMSKRREWWSSKKKFHWDYFALRLLNTEILWIVISRRSHQPKLCGTYTHSR